MYKSVFLYLGLTLGVVVVRVETYLPPPSPGRSVWNKASPMGP